MTIKTHKLNVFGLLSIISIQPYEGALLIYQKTHITDKSKILHINMLILLVLVIFSATETTGKAWPSIKYLCSNTNVLF